MTKLTSGLLELAFCKVSGGIRGRLSKLRDGAKELLNAVGKG